MTSITINYFSETFGTGKSLSMSSLLFSAYECLIESEYDQGYKRGKQDFKRGTKRNLYCFICCGCGFFGDFECGYQEGWEAAQRHRYQRHRYHRYSFVRWWGWSYIFNPFDSLYTRLFEDELGYKQGRKDFRKDEMPTAFLYCFESREYRRGYLQGWEAAQKLEQYISCTNTFKELRNSLETKEFQLGYRQGKNNSSNQYIGSEAQYSWLFNSKEYKRGYEKGWDGVKIRTFVFSFYHYFHHWILSVLPAPTFNRIIQELSIQNYFLNIPNHDYHHHYKELNYVNSDNSNSLWEKEYFREYIKTKLEKIFNLNNMNIKNQEINNFSRGSPLTANIFAINQVPDGGVEIMNKISKNKKLTLLSQQVNIEINMNILWLKSLTFNIIRELRRERDSENVNITDIPDNEIAKFSLNNFST